MNNNYYVYVHYKLSDGLPFYVGKGHGRRAYVFAKRNIHWTRVKNKHGIKVEILFENLTEEEAFSCEIDTILEFKYFGYKLTNKTTGGEGVSGLVVSNETRKLISIANKNKLVSLETRFKLSKANKGSVLTDQHKLKLRNAKLGKYLGDLNPFADTNLYDFIRIKDGFQINCTRSYLANNFNVKRDQLKKLFYKINPRKTACGWKLKG